MKKLLTLLVIVASCASCGVNRPLVATTPQELQMIDKIAATDILSYVELVRKGNFGDYDQAISDTASQALTNVLATLDTPHICIIDADPTVRERVDDETNWLLRHAADKASFDKITVPPTID